MSTAPLFTVFTPTHNRAATLPRVYESLSAQTLRDFEWLIVDDGSTDGTAALVESWIAQAKFPIRYVWQENGHKKAAFNRGTTEARGIFFICADSDDAYVPDALQTFADAWSSIPLDKRGGFAGVTGLCVDQDGNLIGDRFPRDVFDSDNLEVRYRYHVSGEKWGFNRLDVLRENRFPDGLPGHVPEGVVWSRVALKYRTRFINKVVRIYHISEDSITLTGASFQQKRANAFGHAYWAAEIVSRQLGWARYAPAWFLKAASNYTRFRLHMWANHVRPGASLRLHGFKARALVALTAPLGAFRYLLDCLAGL